MEKTHWKKEFNYDYLGSYSLEDGKDVILTISNVKKEKVTGSNGKKEDCLVCYFSEKADWIKPMILNRTNCKTIEKIHGTPFIEEWKGKAVQIGVSRVSAFGDEVDALRIRPKAPVTILPSSGKDYENVLAFLKGGGSMDKVKTKFSVPADVEAKLKEAVK